MTRLRSRTAWADPCAGPTGRMRPSGRPAGHDNHNHIHNQHHRRRNKLSNQPDLKNQKKQKSLPGLFMKNDHAPKPSTTRHPRPRAPQFNVEETTKGAANRNGRFSFRPRSTRHRSNIELGGEGGTRGDVAHTSRHMVGFNSLPGRWKNKSIKRAITQTNMQNQPADQAQSPHTISPTGQHPFLHINCVLC